MKKILLTLSILWIIVVAGVATYVLSYDKQTYHIEFEPYSDAWLTLDATYYGKPFPDKRSQEAFDSRIESIVWVLEEDPYFVGQEIKNLFKSYFADPVWLNTYVVIKGGKITLFEQNFFPQKQAIAMVAFGGTGIFIVIGWITFAFSRKRKRQA